ncbi:hypothetical protein [Pseudomonas viridiflava]|uniref:hypothetical protein n=1 Tax=Pseudomonas viridiflava TaxID=33069 RepID=UPI001C315D69|nr:hypothetical protein [Pseudomonas viridiflava]QXG29545.1 hypothetical protein KTT59_21595 [Pseudomonas viridiflava]
MQELTLVTKSGVFHQAGITYVQSDIWTPHLSEKPKASVYYASCMYTTLASPDGGPLMQFVELVERANGLVTKNGSDPVVGWYIHSGNEMLTTEQIQSVVDPSVAVKKLDDLPAAPDSNEFVSVDGITVRAPKAAPIEKFERLTEKLRTAWRELMDEIMAVEKRDDIRVCLARAEGFALALLDGDLITESQNTMMGVELTDRSTLRDWELQSRDRKRG